MRNLLATLGALVLVTVGCYEQTIDAATELDPRFSYEPDIDLAGPTARALSSLSDATGLAFNVAAGGTRILAAPPGTLIGKNGEADCGHTVITYYKDPFWVVDAAVYVEWPTRPECLSDIARTIEHEVIHNVRRNEDPEGDTHAFTGVFQAYANNLDDALDADSLTCVCEFVECQEFRPE